MFGEKNKKESKTKKTCGQNIDRFTWIFIFILAVVFVLAKFNILPKEILNYIQK